MRRAAIPRTMLTPVDTAAAVTWRAWTFEPGVIIPLALVAAIYARGARRLLRRSRHALTQQRWRAVAFGSGLATLLLALVSPLDALADARFSAHMLQHLLLILAAAPLCVMGAPAPALLWGLPSWARRAVGRRWRRGTAARAAWRLLTTPAVAFTLHMSALWFWHFPGPYDAALHNDAIHALEHASFFGTALVYWWLVVQPVGHRRLGYGPGILFVAATLVLGGALGALLMFSPRPWYAAYALGAASGTSALADQQLAGALMWIPSCAIYVGAAAALFTAWLRTDEALSGFRSEPVPAGDAPA